MKAKNYTFTCDREADCEASVTLVGMASLRHAQAAAEDIYDWLVVRKSTNPVYVCPFHSCQHEWWKVLEVGPDQYDCACGETDLKRLEWADWGGIRPYHFEGPQYRSLAD